MKNGSMLPADCGIVRAVAQAMELDVEHILCNRTAF